MRAETKNVCVDEPKQENKKGNKKEDGCFIATVCYGIYDAEEVLLLRHFRDHILLKYSPGIVFVKLYYFISPPLSKIIDRSLNTKFLLKRYFLNPLVKK